MNYPPLSIAGEIVVGFLICVGFFSPKYSVVLEGIKNNIIILAAKFTLNKRKFQGREFPYLSVTNSSGPDLRLQVG